MPLVGVMDGDICFDFNSIPRAMLSPELVKTLKGEARSGIHITDLSICPHQAARNKYYDYYIPLHAAYRMLRGKAWDNLCQQGRVDGRSVQATFMHSLNGEIITGTPDIVDWQRGTVEDYKAPAHPYSRIPEAYKIQLNGYYWLIENHHPGMIKQLYINICAPNGYTQLSVPLWSLHETETILIERLAWVTHLLQHPPINRCANKDCVYCRGEVRIREEYPKEVSVCSSGK